jgi:dolichol-phosphate mannosyltransferase
MKLAIALPTYNEAENIKKLLPQIKNYVLKYPNLYTSVLVIDDSSPDGTANVADGLSAMHQSDRFTISVLSRKRKEGLGKAYIHAFKVLLREDYDFILQMDADLSHNPQYIPLLLEASAHSDLVVGSRYVKGGSTPDWTFKRKSLSRGGNLYARFVLGSDISDYTSGFNLFSTELLKKVSLDSITTNGYGFLIELKYRAKLLANNVSQVPIIFLDRQTGYSKLPSNTLLSNFLLVIKIRLSKNDLLIKSGDTN